MLFWQRLDDKIISVLIMTKNKLLNSNQLKLIAIVAMTVDHIAWAVFPGYPLDAVPVIMHIIGRAVSNWQVDLPDYVLFYCRGLPLHKKYKQIHFKAFYICCNFTFCLYICIK